MSLEGEHSKDGGERLGFGMRLNNDINVDIESEQILIAFSNDNNEDNKNDADEGNHIVITPRKHSNMNNEIEGTNEYEWIQKSLEQCDKLDWQKYLNNFKKHKITDKRIKLFPFQHEIWKILLPEIGVRYEFIEMAKIKLQVLR